MGNLKEARKLLENKEFELNIHCINKVDERDGETPLTCAISILGEKKKLDLKDEFDSIDKRCANHFVANRLFH